MASPAQIFANQANSQKSTGPQTPEGKAASSENRRTHGLTYDGGRFAVLPGEDQNDFEGLRAALDAEYEPATPTASLLVERLAQHQWLRDRALRLQESCFDPNTGQIADQKTFCLYMRYATTHERAFHKCLADLLKLRVEERKAISAEQASRIGFEREKRCQEIHPLQLAYKEMQTIMLQIREKDAFHRQAAA